MYNIVGFRHGRREVIDHADTKESADYLRREYASAFGSSWSITVELSTERDEAPADDNDTTDDSKGR